jgi:polysaccharide export outer membrane protein
LSLKIKALGATVALLALLVGAGWPLPAARAQTSPLEPYRVGIYDVLQLSIYQEPELDRALTVDENGNISVPLIGDVRAEGRTLVELENEILQRIQVYHRNVTRVALEVTAYDSRAIYVLGAVITPGKHAVYPIPNLWQAIREAGGITAEGDLSRVRIYRNVDGQQILETHNLEALIAQEGLLAVPGLNPGDTVEVPSRPATPGTYPGHDGIYVLGEVITPGIYRTEPSSHDVLSFILQAGGHTEIADLKKVFLLRLQADGSLGRQVLNIERYMEHGELEQNPQVKPGDTIFVSRRPAMSESVARNLSVITSLVAVVTSMATLVLLYRNR